MAKVVFDKVSLQRVFKEEISGRLLIDLGAEGGKKSLTNDYEQHIKQITDRIVNLQNRVIQEQVKKDYTAGLQDIQNYLNQGFEGVVGTDTLHPPASPTNLVSGWKPLHLKYFKHKLKHHASTSRLFWRKSGQLSQDFEEFRTKHTSSVNSSQSTVELVSKDKKFRQRTYRYKMDFTLPKPETGGAFFETILQKSFFEGKSHKVLGHSLSGGLEILGYLEGLSLITKNKHRPFVSRLMAQRGLDFAAKVGKLIKTQAI